MTPQRKQEIREAAIEAKKYFRGHVVDGLLNNILELTEPEATVTTDYETASKLFVDQDPAAVMQAFMSGKIKIDGDMMKVMGMQTAIPQTGDAATIALAIAAEIKAMTAVTAA